MRAADARFSASTITMHFHQVVVGRRACRLQDEHVAAAHVLEQLDHHLAVGEPADHAAPEADD